RQGEKSGFDELSPSGAWFRCHCRSIAPPSRVLMVVGSLCPEDPMRLLAGLLLLIMPVPAIAQNDPILLHPARVFDGVDPRPHEGWSVLVRGDRIEAAGPNLSAPPGAKTVVLPG